MHRSQILSISLLCMHVTAASVWAVKSATWVHDEPKNFIAAELDREIRK